MDTTPENIKKCKKAEEIQKEWKPQQGDIFFDSEIDEKQIYIEKTQEKFGIPFKFNKKLGFGIVMTGIFVCDSCQEETDLYPFNKFYPQDDLIWLPRQDQLQKMIDNPPVWQFHYFVQELTRQGIQSMSYEQLWLAFVMKEKYNKIWNGDEWVNEKV